MLAMRSSFQISPLLATASAVLFAGALPVLVDVRPDTYCIDPDLVERSHNPSHQGCDTRSTWVGHPADLDRLVEIS